ncbi:MAG: S8 family serine peptidase [Patescibacteria group bacterium]|nr:S8 family serine peptidase [Patescibacteria group bacterium]
MKKFIFCTIIFVFVAVQGAQAFTPNDTDFSRQWYLRQIDAERAWDISTGSPKVIVAVIDTAVDISHPELDGNAWINEDEIPANGIDDDKNDYIDDVNGWNFSDNNGNILPNFSNGYAEEGISHGTAVASIIAAEGNNRNGMAGITWESKIMPLQVLDATGNGFSDNVAKAIYYAIRNGADVINLSFVGFNFSEDMSTAVRRAWEAGVVVVAAAGNTPDESGGSNLDMYDEFPVCIDQYENEIYVLGVAATDTLDQKAKFSNFGKACVDVSAPGMDIWSARVYNSAIADFDTFYDDDWSGTSFAAPIVSGVSALVKSIAPGLSAREINEILVKSGVIIDGINPDFAGGLGTRVDARAALELALEAAKSGSSLVIGAPLGFTPVVRELGSGGEVKDSFAVFPDSFKKGFTAQSGDVNNDGQKEIVVGAGPGGGPQVRIFSETGKLYGQFFAYNSLFRGGVNIAVGNVDSRTVNDEIITAPGPGGGPHILVFNERGEIQGNFMAYTSGFRGGVTVTAGDIDADDTDEIIVGFIDAGVLHIKIFRKSGVLVSNFQAAEKITGPIFVATQNLDTGEEEEILVTYKTDGNIYIKSFDRNGAFLRSANWATQANQFDLKAFYDYIVGEVRIAIAEIYNNKINLRFISGVFDNINAVEIK